jgi:pimeloyl-ACP methyl ester carboxylesterase
MGGGVASIFAGAYPEVVDKLVLIEGFGPMSKPAQSAASSMRRALDGEAKFNSKEISINGGRLYGSVHEAVGDVTVVCGIL